LAAAVQPVLGQTLSIAIMPMVLMSEWCGHRTASNSSIAPAPGIKSSSLTCWKFRSAVVERRVNGNAICC
jgi:hypothetical protein